MAVAVKTDPTFEPGQTTELFQTALTPQATPFLHRYAVSNDGQRFLIPAFNNSPVTGVDSSPYYGGRQLDRHAPEEVTT